MSARALPRRLAAVLALAAATAFAPGAGAQGFDPTGRYELVDPPQQTETPGKIEVVDVFWYGCPHCYRFLPFLERYEKEKPDYVEIRRLPAIFRKSWEIHARAYYTAKLLGVDRELHRPIFDAIHRDKNRLDTREKVRAFFVAHGVDGKAFDDTFESFAVESLIRKSAVMQGRYGVRGTPTVIVNGKYRASAGLAGSYENLLKVIEALVDKEHREQLAAR